MKRKFIHSLSVVYMAAAMLTQAAEVLLKNIPGPSANAPLYSEGAGSIYGKTDDHWNPGFRSASSGTHLYVTGWTGASNAQDGFITKMDSFGGVHWTKDMRTIMGTSDIGWRINDVAIYNNVLYVCGERTDGSAFIAKITSEGLKLDYALFQGNTGSTITSSYARANAIAVSVLNGQPAIVVAGDARGESMVVKERQSTHPKDVFHGLTMLHTSGSFTNGSEAWVVRFDESLGANWGTTWGYQHSHDFATAVETDNTGAIFLAVKSENPDRYHSSVMSNMDDLRKVETRVQEKDEAGILQYETNGRPKMIAVTTSITGGVYSDYDFWGGSSSLLIKLDTSVNKRATPVVSFFQPCKLEGGENGSTNRIVDMVYDSGQLYLAGEWSNWIRPFAHNQEAQHRRSSARKSNGSHSTDVWTCILNASDLKHQEWQLFSSADDDFVCGLTVDTNGVYLAGSAGGGMSYSDFIGNGTNVGGSSANHLFWEKLGRSNLGHEWHLTPVEATESSIAIPNVQRTAGIGFAGETLIVTGYWSGGNLTLGDRANRKTLPKKTPDTAQGFAGFLRPDGSWYENFSIVINSEYGAPVPHLGTGTVAAGTGIAARVAQEVYEDAAGNILDASNTALINANAVTRRICTGYQFKNSTENGTANEVQFVANADTELTFLWRTEHAVEIDSNIVGTGLSSTAAGNPTPSVQKHWIPENDQFTAFIDGAESDPTVPGTRWRSVGFAASGCVASAQGIASGSLFTWNDYQPRQQTAKITVGSPGRITWQWAKEHSLRVAVNSLVGQGSPTVMWRDGDYRAQGNSFGDSSYQYVHYPGSVTSDTLTIRFNLGTPPPKLRINVADILHQWETTDVDVPSGTSQGDEVSFRFPGRSAKWFEAVGLNESGGITSNQSNDWGVVPRKQGSGVGEYWASVGSEITVSSATSVDSGKSTLALKGYTGGQGSVTPFAESDVASKTIRLTHPSSITWDYARQIHQETVSIGNALTFNGVTGEDSGRVNKQMAPLGGNVSSGPSGSAWGDMFIWDAFAKRLYPLRPGKFTVEFENTAAADDPAQNVIVEIDSQWPGSAHFQHIIETPPVILEPSFTDSRSFQKLAFSESRATLGSTNFSAREEGRSVLVFSDRSGNAANGDLERESLQVRVVQSIHWKASAGEHLEYPEIGQEINPDSYGHRVEGIGHNGHVIHPRAPVNAALYDPVTLSGPIIPVNERMPSDEDTWLAVAWYQQIEGINWPTNAKSYDPQWPFHTDRIVIASRLGSEGLDEFDRLQPPYGQPYDRNPNDDAPPTYDYVNNVPVRFDPVIYNQPDRSSMGYNPNEEHALAAPSFLEASRPAVFALHEDLNRADPNQAEFTSKPYVLVQYTDRQNEEEDVVVRMAVYKVIEEDADTTDPRLPEFNQTYTYFYQGEAGLRLVPPHPLDVVLGGSPIPTETSGDDVGGRISYYEDKNNMPWVVSGDTNTDANIHAVWYYPLRSDFWHPERAFGEAVALGRGLGDGGNHNIKYDTVWPDDVAVLKAGETLTFAGGEYAADNNSLIPQPKGLPQAVAWQSARLVFDEANTFLEPSIMGSKYLARVFPALEAYEVDLALTAVPSELTPASGNVIVDGLLWRFKQLPASLQERIYYNTSNEKLGVRGLLNGRILGDGDLLAAPGAQTIVQPNVLTSEDESLIQGLASSAEWQTAVSEITSLSRNPKAATVTGSLGIGLEPADWGGAQPSNSFGPGLAVVTNPDLQDPSTASALPDGYITISENDHEDLGDAPVAIHVIKVTREKYRGSVAVMEPENVFDEKVSLRHTADFGGDVSDLHFEWYLREEDGRDLNPPGIDLPDSANRSDSSWALFKKGKGVSEIQLAGSGPRLITDNLVFCRYGYGDNPSEWSAWAGAANSREPKSTTDAPYVAQLVPGWVKRVTEAVNLFDARYDDFRNNNAPATYTSALQQAGQRWEGPVAFNPNKDAIENVGLIELYQTVLDRAEDFTIASASGTDGVNTALLNAANRIAGLYTLFGNEAYADALDPTIGYSTVGGEFGTLAPAIHAFQNQTANLLEEELTLLRGRGEVGARPAYNRLMWNFTNGPGEAAYVLNYSINDLTNDGFLDDEDGRRLYPQGHGDAWGHYTMALKGYYDLATTENFTWSPRSEKVNIDGVVLDVDYLDERAFAKTAVARARCGAELVDLTYRQAYTENPNGQWQGYQDTDTDRAWGVFETAQRAGTGALFDWMLGNALLPAEDNENSGIRKVDRSTVVELREIAHQASNIQAKLDLADRGLNPAGLDPNVVSFDIDPVLTDRSDERAATHFEQVYDRATAAAENALHTFNQANEIALQLRKTEATSETLRQQTIDQDLAYRNQLIELFGTPYEGMIGSGKAYPAGYQGPDLYLFMYVDQVSAGNDDLVDPLDRTIVETTIVPGLRNLSAHDLLAETVSNYFPADLLSGDPGAEITLNLPRQASGYALVAPDSWGQRRSPGAIQAAVQGLVQSEWRVRMATDAYESQADDFQALLRKFELKSGISSDKIRVAAHAEELQDTFHSAATAAFAVGTVVEKTLETIDRGGDAAIAALPTVVGLATDPSSAIRGALGMLKLAHNAQAHAALGVAQIAQYRLELEADEALVEMEQALLTEDLKSELVDILDEMWQLVNAEGDAALAVVDALETMRASSERVRTVLEQGQAVLDERTVFNTRVASTTTKQRYEDYTFRIFHNESLRKYRSVFDLAGRYAYLAGKAYQYELNLPENHAANAAPLLAEILKTRSLGEWQGGEPVLGNGGLADTLAVLKTNFDTLKGQLGFNNPDTDINAFSIRTELARIGLSSRVNADWRTQLENWRVPDLWNYQYQHNGVNYGYVFRRYCRSFAPESAGPQPALVIPFDSTIAAGQNWFGNILAGGDSAFNASNFSTKIRAAGVRFDGYNNTAMSQTPQVYFVPVGDDRMFLPDSSSLEHRSWRVEDQRIPAPIPVTPSNLSNPDWQPFTGSANGLFEDIRKFSSFRAYHDAGGWSDSEMLQSSRLVGRSVWNSQWVLIIPNASLLSNPNNATSGIDTFIHGAPLPGYDQATAELTNRDRIGIRDIRILLQTYSVSGN